MIILIFSFKFLIININIMNKKFFIFTMVILLIIIVYAIVLDIKEAREMDMKGNNVVGEDNFSTGVGYIEGALYGWSEVLPIGLHICAKNINTEYYYCTDNSFDDPKFKYGKGYKLEVPVGSYQVAGILPSSLINPEKLREFKSVSESCDQQDIECLSTLNVIEVSKGEISGADLNSKGKLDLFKTFDLTQYPNYK